MIAVAVLCIEYYTPGITRNLSKACTREKSLGEMRKLVDTEIRARSLINHQC